MTNLVYHFTDTARLPWILRSGVLRPGQNGIGGFPDPDFLWATSQSQGDLTSSAEKGALYRSGKIRHVRFSLMASDFFPWSDVSKRFEGWNSEQVERLERTAANRSRPGDWWFRVDAQPLESCLAIETRSYTDKRWADLPTAPTIETMKDSSGKEWLALRFGRHLVYSKPCAEGYEIGEIQD